MFAREYRLPPTTKLFHARFVKTELFAIKYAANNLTVSRFAFVVKKSIDKRAVARNRIRRLFRSCVEELREQILPGYDMLFFLEKGIMDVKREQLLKDLREFLEMKSLFTHRKSQKSKLKTTS